jgi:glycosyltransferase involved in cell wall biosynthesis
VKSLVFPDAPELVQQAKDRNPGEAFVAGAPLVRAEIAAALLRHGTWDRYYFLAPSEQARRRTEETLAQYSPSGRAHVLPLENAHELGQAGSTVLFRASIMMAEMLGLRAIMTRRSPIAGLTHSLSYLPQAFAALSLLLEDFTSFDCVICTSQAGRTALLNLIATQRAALESRGCVIPEPRFRTPVIPLAVQTELFQRNGRAQARRDFEFTGAHQVLLYLGRLSAVSKMDPFPLLIEFANSVAVTHPDAILVFAGDDTRFAMAGPLLACARELGCADRVRVVPNITQAQKLALYAAADIFLFASDNVQETFGISLLEAMASGLPVVAADWNGCREIVNDGETGLLAPVRWPGVVGEVSTVARLRSDVETHGLLAQSVVVDLSALFRAVGTLLDQPELRARMGDQGRRRVRTFFDWPVVVRQYEELWDDLLAGVERAPQAPAGPGISAYDYHKVFGHYATKLLDRDTLVTLTQAGRRHAASGSLPQALRAPQSVFQPVVMHALLASAAEQPQSHSSRLLDAARRTAGCSEDVAMLHLVRLAKYGMILLICLE